MNSNPNTATNKPSGLTFRAFISNPLQAYTVGVSFPVLDIVDATQDLISDSTVNLSGISSDPGLMVETPNYAETLVFSSADKTLTVVDNATESASSSSKVTLPGVTDSVAIDPFSTFAYAAVPTAPVAGQSPGAVIVLAISKSSLQIAATIPVPGARYVVESPDGLHLLVFSDDSNSLTIITPILIGTATDPRTVVSGFDRPVWGLFGSDSSTAYILNCGPQCGGSTASVAVIGVPTGTITDTVPVDAATTGLIQGTTLYVAGTPAGADCGGTSTAATTCGRLDTIDLNSMTVTGSAVVTDGYHDRIAMGANYQLFLGAHNCTDVNTSSEVRGCLSIVQTGSSKVIIPPAIGDVTGIQPITNRSVVYVCQNGKLAIYDTTTDKLQATQVSIGGQAVDVKLADGPP